MNLIIIQAPLGDGSQRTETNQRLFPWGLAQVARCLEDDGHQIEILDVYGLDMIREEILEYLNHADFDAACISGFSSINYVFVTWLAKEIKERYAKPVIVGGILADHHYELLLSGGEVDFCVLGEGERSSVELMRNLHDPSKVKGLAYRHNGSIQITEPRKLIRDLDALPMPNFDLWPMERYLRTKMYAHQENTRFDDYAPSMQVSKKDLLPNLTFLSGRGCPYKCTYCSRSYQSLRLKSVDRLIEEIQWSINRFGLKAVHFADELLLVNKKRIREFCEKVKPLGVYWDGQGRVNTVDKESMVLMRNSGCLSLGLGIESGSDQMLKAMRKGVSRAQNLRALKDGKTVGLHLKVQLLAGYPGETKQTLAETASLIKEAGLPPRRANWCTPLPGSELYGWCLEQGLIPDEDAYLRSLVKGYNKPGNVVLNVSGHSDDEMIRLLKWLDLKMDQDYIFTLLGSSGGLKSPRFWEHLRHTVDEWFQFHLPGLRHNRWLRAIGKTLMGLVQKVSQRGATT